MDNVPEFEAILGILGQSLGAPGLTREVSGCSNLNSKAAYIQSSIDLTDKWSMTLGARYTKDKKEAQVNNGLIFDIVYPESGWVPGYTRPEGQLVPTVLDDEEEWSRFTPRAGVEYLVVNGNHLLRLICLLFYPTRNGRISRQSECIRV